VNCFDIGDSTLCQAKVWCNTNLDLE